MTDSFPKPPEFIVNQNKNGYEIRTEILQMAKDLVWQDFHYRYMGWEALVEKDPVTGQLVTKVGMPEFPGLDRVLETAEKMYSFVNLGPKAKHSR